MLYVKKYWPSIVPGIVAIWAVYGAQVTSFVSAHPAIATVVGAGYAIFTHLMPSPTASK